MHQSKVAWQQADSVKYYYAKGQNARRQNPKRHHANRHHTKRQNANRDNAERHNAKRHNANRHNAKGHNANGYHASRRHANNSRLQATRFCLVWKPRDQKLRALGPTQARRIVGYFKPRLHDRLYMSTSATPNLNPNSYLKLSATLSDLVGCAGCWSLRRRIASLKREVTEACELPAAILRRRWAVRAVTADL